MVSTILSSLLTMVMMLVGVAFFIVTERKGLSMIQIRKGPNKVSVKALAQAIADGVKLVTKGWAIPSAANKSLFILGPVFCFFLSYIMWVVFPSFHSCGYFSLSLLFFICVSCVNVYGVLLVGWSSNSQYAFLGSMRAVAQSISYEVSMSTIVFCPLLFLGSFELMSFREDGFFFLLLFLEVFIMWVISVLAETNRAPFDFVEGESELVSGYNVEFGGVGFALIALAEYGNIIFMSLLSCIIFFGGVIGWSLGGGIVVSGVVFGVSYWIVMIRGTFPRLRYDILMSVCWTILLPLSLALFGFYVVVGL